MVAFDQCVMHISINFGQGSRKVKNIGGASNNLPSPVGIGLTDLPNIGGASGPPGPPGSGITVGY